MIQSFKKNELIQVHPEAKEMSMVNKFFIYTAFKKYISDGPLGIDHFSLMLVSPKNVASFYSVTAALEYNLIVSDLWRHDGIFLKRNHQENSFFFWDDLYSELKREELRKEKELNFGFNFGCSIVLRVDNFSIVLNFSTKSIHKEMRPLYVDSKRELIKIGIFFYNQIKPLCQTYYQDFICPKISATERKPVLRLVTAHGKEV